MVRVMFAVVRGVARLSLRVGKDKRPRPLRAGGAVVVLCGSESLGRRGERPVRIGGTATVQHSAQSIITRVNPWWSPATVRVFHAVETGPAHPSLAAERRSDCLKVLLCRGRAV